MKNQRPDTPADHRTQESELKKVVDPPGLTGRLTEEKVFDPYCLTVGEYDAPLYDLLELPNIAQQVAVRDQALHDLVIHATHRLVHPRRMFLHEMIDQLRDITLPLPQRRYLYCQVLQHGMEPLVEVAASGLGLQGRPGSGDEFYVDVPRRREAPPLEKVL